MKRELHSHNADIPWRLNRNTVLVFGLWGISKIVCVCVCVPGRAQGQMSLKDADYCLFYIWIRLCQFIECNILNIRNFKTLSEILHKVTEM